MSETQIQTVQAEILPQNLEAEIQKAVQMRAALDKLFNTVLQQGVDFDRIPGTDKPTLLKPGADLLCQIFRLASGEPKIISCKEDFEEGIFSYLVAVPIMHRDTGILIATGIGGANSREVKYKYRNVEQDGEKVKVLNPEPADQQNTLIKMAAKRAYIDGVLKATGASRMFTQDIEDMPWLLPEKASNKQINYIKNLYKGIKEEEMLTDISELIGHDIASLQELTRDEATKVIESKKEKLQNATSNNDKASDSQINYIHKLLKDKNISEDAYKKVLKTYSVESSKELSKKQASEIIDRLSKLGQDQQQAE